MRCAAILVVCSAATAHAEPLFAISEDTLVARTAVGPAWAGDDRALAASLKLGATANYHLLAADLELGFASSAGLIVVPSVGVKPKFLSTPQNMGYTYIYAGARVMRLDGDTRAVPCLGVRDFITYDVVAPWAFALEWQAIASAHDGEMTLDGGVAIGVARAEETARNLAVLIGWRRDRFAAGAMTYRSDGAFVTVSHQWR